VNIIIFDRKNLRRGHYLGRNPTISSSKRIGGREEQGGGGRRQARGGYEGNESINGVREGNVRHSSAKAWCLHEKSREGSLDCSRRWNGKNALGKVAKSLVFRRDYQGGRLNHCNHGTNIHRGRRGRGRADTRIK